MYASLSTRLCWRCAARLRLSARFASSLADACPPFTPPSAPRIDGSQRAVAAAAGSGHGPGRAAFNGRRPRRLTSNASDESALALFNDVVNRAQAPSPPDAAAAAPPAEGAVARRFLLGEWEIAAKMKELGEKRVSACEKLALFRADIWPHVSEMRGQMPRHLYISTVQFLGAACDAVADEGRTGSSVDLSRMCGRIGKWDLDLRNELVLSLCHTLVSRRPAVSERSVLFTELLNLWRHISQLRRKSQGYSSTLQFVLPSADEIYRHVDQGPQRASNMAAPTKALASILIQFSLEQARELVPGLLATLAVLSDLRLARPSYQVEAAPLLNLVAAAVPRESIHVAYVSHVLSATTRFPPAKLSELRTYVVAQWPQATALVYGTDAPWRQRSGALQSQRPASLRRFNEQFRAAYGSRIVGAIISVWQDFTACVAQRPALVKELREEPDLLDYCIFVWCAMRRPAKLQETLSLMQELEVSPTVKSYTAMIHGWKLCRDLDKITALWDRLVESGGKLDAVIWTARISGLCEGGRPQAAIQALAEMMAQWKQAVASKGAEGATGVAVQPTIEAINATVKGLLGVDPRAAHEVLAWAGRHGIEPNTHTYNMLLRESFRRNKADGVQSLLGSMTKQGLEPDGATFTIILEETLGVLDNTSAAEQIHAVEQTLADIKAAGVRANQETYAKVLYAVSSLADGGADEAVAATLKHMRAAGMSPTPHMVTILLERTLARDAQAPGAVQALLREHGLTHIGQGDQTLWERVVGAHAATGDTQAAMAVFQDLARAGRPVTSLPCLLGLLRALLAAGRLDDARAVVRVALVDKKGRPGGDRDARHWHHRFWYLAWEHRLLKRDEVPVDLWTGTTRWSDGGGGWDRGDWDADAALALD